MAVKLRKPTDLPLSDDLGGQAPQTVPLKPLAVSGVRITKSALIEALRIYIPNLADIEIVEDGERLLADIAARTTRGRRLLSQLTR